ncbi:MAG: hypothetical protein KatS3mg109_0235 [Pirellulaceae bacterium]|nr:MAG: hypothetical protein KatS3mg109_0235 [Pirellulaceae bacterium]
MSIEFDAWREWLGLADNWSGLDYYSLLGVPRGETNVDVLRRACDGLIVKVRSIRPGPHTDQWTEILDLLQQVRATLTDAKLKQQYDRLLSEQPRQASLGALRMQRATHQVPHAVGAKREPQSIPDSHSEMDGGKTPTTGTLDTDPAMAPFVPDFTPVTTEPDPMAPLDLPAMQERAAVPVTSDRPLAGKVEPLAWGSVAGSASSPAATPGPADVPARSGQPARPISNLRTAADKRLTAIPTPTALVIFTAGTLCGAVATVCVLWVAGLLSNSQGVVSVVQGPTPPVEPSTAGADSHTQPSDISPDRAVRESNGPTVFPSNPVASGKGNSPADHRANIPPDVPPAVNADSTSVSSGVGSEPSEKPQSGEPSANSPETMPEKPSAGSPTESPSNNLPPLSAEERQQLVEAFHAARKALLEQHPDQARPHLEAAQPLLRTEEHRVMFGRLQQLAAYLEQYHQAVQQALQTLSAGDSLQISDTVVVGIVERQPTELTVRVSGRNMTYPLDQLPLRLGLALVRHALKDSATSLAVQAAFQATHPRANDAQQAEAFLWWEQAAQLGEPCQSLPQVFTDNYDALLPK